MTRRHVRMLAFAALGTAAALAAPRVSCAGEARTRDATIAVSSSTAASALGLTLLVDWVSAGDRSDEPGSPSPGRPVEEWSICGGSRMAIERSQDLARATLQLLFLGADLPLRLIFAGVIGGLIAFGVIGLFIGPVVLAVGYMLLLRRVSESTPSAEPGPSPRPDV